jgi:hypothetical protein
MAYNGSGTYVTTNPPPFTYNTIISETQMNAAFTDIANALSAVLVRDGQAAMTGTLNMGAQNITAIGNGSAASPSLRWGDGQGFYRSAANEISVSTNGTLRQTLKSDGSWLFGTTATQWKLDASDRMFNPGNTQPSFSAYRSTSQTSGSVVIFDTELFDQGGVYNNTTGVFTAPVDGVYAITWTVDIFNNSGSGVQWVVALSYNNGASTYSASTNSTIATGNAHQVSGAMHLRLAANDTLRISVPALSANFSARSAGGRECTFSVHLLS